MTLHIEHWEVFSPGRGYVRQAGTHTLYSEFGTYSSGFAFPQCLTAAHQDPA